MRSSTPRAHFLEAAELARRLGDPVRLATAALGLGGAGFRPWWTEQDLVDDVLVELLEEALAVLDDGDTVLRVRLLGSLAQQLFVFGETDRRQWLADESLAMARRINEPATLVQALFYWRMASWQFANVHARLAVSSEALELAETLDQRELVMQALSFRLVDLLELGDVVRADADAAALEAAARELHVPYYEWATTLYAGMRAIMEGRFADAEAIVNASFEVGQHRGPCRRDDGGGAIPDTPPRAGSHRGVPCNRCGRDRVRRAPLAGGTDPGGRRSGP